jgi:hypothetical protein
MAGNELLKANSLQIPKGTKVLMHQVAGHVFGRKNKIGILFYLLTVHI